MNPIGSTGTHMNSYSFGTANANTYADLDRQIYYQTKYKMQGFDMTAGTGVDGDSMWLALVRDNDSRFFNGVFYSLLMFPYSMPEFLIERQLKKHELGTLHPGMVEFRPVVEPDERIKSISYYIDLVGATPGNYYPIGSGLGIAVELEAPYKVNQLKINGVSAIPNADHKGFNATLDSNTPQKITMDIVVDETLVQFNPIVTINTEEHGVIEYADANWKTVKPGDWLAIGSLVTILLYRKDIEEVVNATSTDVEIQSNIGWDERYNHWNIKFNLTDKSPQKINITIDEYIRYEDIVQPYPVLLRFNDENGNEVSWGGKFRVGSTITRIGSIADPENNLLNGLYSVSGLSLNGKAVTSSTSIVEKQMVFRTTATWLLDNNEPKVILSPSRLRIPNSSYKLLGYIPDISGHGNNGKINNSAYAEGSGVNEDGSYQFDGVDDFVTIPTVTSGGKQMLMKVNWQKSPALLYDQRASGSFAVLTTLEDDAVNPRIAYQARNQNGKTYIDGIENNNIETYTLKDITHNITIANSSLGGIIVPVIGCNTGKSSNFAKMSLYDFMLFDNISTDDKIKELNEYVGIEAKVELPPYYWDAYGKTNSDADKDTIQQRGIAVGDYDLTNTNFAYDKMSGFGGYTLGKFTNSWSLSNNSNSISIVARNPYDITLKKLGENRDWEFKTTELKIISNPVSVKFKSDKNIRLTCDYHYYTVGGNSEGAPLGITSKDLIANEDTIITISPISQENIDKYNIDINRGYYFIYFQLSLTLAVNEEVTIEMLPLYPNGLVYDGVEDFSDNKNVPLIDDFTVIAKRTWLEVNTSDKPFIIKGDTLYPDGNKNAFLFEYGKLSTYSFGQNNKYDESVVPSLISWATPTSYNGTTSLVRGSAIDTVGIDIAHATKIVLYKLILYPKTIPLLQINFLKNLMEKDEIIDLNNPIFIQE